jgi:SNF2 family DNA or RNA helicase
VTGYGTIIKNKTIALRSKALDIEISKKIIKELCGIVSFNKGDFFYRANKVVIEACGPDYCEATVKGSEDFHVKLKKDENGELHTTCSCPTLASVKQNCQHVAAVLLAIDDRRRHGVSPETINGESALAQGLLTLFKKQPSPSIGRRAHFDTREVLDVGFILQPVSVGKGLYLMGITLQVGQTWVDNIREFLGHLKTGQLTMISSDFAFHQNHHCFSRENNAVIERLIQIVKDEKVYMDSLQGSFGRAIQPEMLLIPPSSWNRLLPLLTLVPKIEIKHNGETYQQIHISKDTPPLDFDFSDDYVLTIKGLSDVTVLKVYQAVLYKGHWIHLEGEEADRLLELKHMMQAHGTDKIPIPGHQMGYFLEKVVPGLKRLGAVRLSEAITQERLQIPLKARLYLDRVKNRLLAGLEFQYENISFNPLEEREPKAHFMFIRDSEKEDKVLQMMEDSQFTKTDSGYFLHNEELEFEFLYHTVPELEKIVQVYATTAVKNRVQRGQPKPIIKIKVKKERMNWLEFKFEMKGISDQEIKDILKALEEKRKYYRLRNGSLLPLSTREFDQINYLLNAIPTEKDELEAIWELPFIQAFPLLDAAEDVISAEASFRKFLEDMTHPDRLSFKVPKQLDSVLRDYQKHGFKWMKMLASLGFGGILADDMGLGKTVQSIAYILSERPVIEEKKEPILIVCPSSLTYNWLGELNKFAPEISVTLMEGSKRERAELQKETKDTHVVITSYPLLLKDIDWYLQQTFHTAFFDEAQSFKNPVTQTAKAVKKLKADHRFALTGTPVENSLEELWSIFHVVFPELFRGFKDYNNLTRQKIARRARPFLLRRKKEDVLSELPEKIETLETRDLLPEQKKLYAAYLAKLRHDTLKHLNKETLRKNKIRILAGLTRLRQICCHPALFVDGYKGSSAKFEQLKQLIEESRLSGKRVLIFSQFTKMLSIIGRDMSLQGIPFFYLDGGTPSEERLERVNRFNAGERDFFLISLKAGGTGLNLTGADTVILYDLWWNPAVEEQAADRAHRMGQENVVEVIKLVAKGTIEEKMNELQDKKRLLIEEIIDSKDKSTTSLTEDDIREILMI